MVKAALPILLLATALVGSTAIESLWRSKAANATPIEESSRPIASSYVGPIQPIPLRAESDSQLIALGERLFSDRRLHLNERKSCADCHNLQHGGANGLRVTQNGADQGMAFNTPSIFNVAYNKQYYWSARFTSLDQQLDDAIAELGVTWKQLVDRLTAIPEYTDRFKRVFPENGITVDNIKQALIAFELSLVTPNSRFDKYLRGDSKALSNYEKKGYDLFTSYGCVACHQGVNAGGNLAIDRTELYPQPRNFGGGDIPPRRNGLSLSARGNQKIRVPSLRNVALTAPYFHDGSAATLEQAVEIMALQAGVRIPPQDVSLIVAFLRTLTGEYNGKSL